MPRVTHLRMYTLKPETDMRNWAERFRSRVIPLRLKHGFAIEGPWITVEPPAGLVGAGPGGAIPWVTETGSRFVYLVSYDGPESWEAKNAAYYGSAEYAALPPEINEPIVERRMWFVSAFPPT